MKRWIVWMLVLCIALMSGCTGMTETPADNAPADQAVTAPVEKTEEPEATEEPAAEPEQTEEPAEEPGQTETPNTISPLPDTTMENLTDATVAVSLEKGDVYVDDEGILQMKVKIYTYDLYDMVDIATLKVGDVLVRHDGEVEVTALNTNENGTVYVNGGLDEGGFDLVTDDSGVYFEMGYSDMKSWYEVGEATLRVSADFVGKDRADLDLGEVEFYPGSFLNEEVVVEHFTPHNTTIRIEDGQVVEMTRRYTP